MPSILAASASDAYLTLIDENNVLQQSWRHQFFLAFAPLPFDPIAQGIYNIVLTAFDGQSEVTSTQIRVNIVTESMTMALLGICLAGIGVARRRARKA